MFEGKNVYTCSSLIWSQGEKPVIIENVEMWWIVQKIMAQAFGQSQSLPSPYSLSLPLMHSYTNAVSILAGCCLYNDPIFPDWQGALGFVCHTRRREAVWVQVDHPCTHSHTHTHSEPLYHIMESSHRLPVSTEAFDYQGTGCSLCCTWKMNESKTAHCKLRQRNYVVQTGTAWNIFNFHFYLCFPLLFVVNTRKEHLKIKPLHICWLSSCNFCQESSREHKFSTANFLPHWRCDFTLNFQLAAFTLAIHHSPERLSLLATWCSSDALWSI